MRSVHHFVLHFAAHFRPRTADSLAPSKAPLFSGSQLSTHPEPDAVASAGRRTSWGTVCQPMPRRLPPKGADGAVRQNVYMAETLYTVYPMNTAVTFCPCPPSATRRPAPRHREGLPAGVEGAAHRALEAVDGLAAHRAVGCTRLRRTGPRPTFPAPRRRPPVFSVASGLVKKVCTA